MSQSVTGNTTWNPVGNSANSGKNNFIYKTRFTSSRCKNCYISLNYAQMKNISTVHLQNPVIVVMVDAVSVLESTVLKVVQ